MLQDMQARQRSVVSLRWADILRAIERHGYFKSVNDERIREYVDTQRKAEKARDAERKRADREAERRLLRQAGEFDDEFLDRVRRETIHRRLGFERALQHPQRPRWARQCAHDTASFTARTWQAKTLIIARGGKVNPSSVATELIIRELVETTNHNALRDRVRAAMVRIEKLERTMLPGSSEPIWTPVSIDELDEPPETLWWLLPDILPTKLPAKASQLESKPQTPHR